ncbi:MAG TPA: asparagine synthase (glutamine-hydrolyzing) [Microvirga sp.]|jgi:asparagine synthase (glutamine-hydrolysing)
MCGIFGWALPDSMRLDEGQLIGLTDCLQHRGPNAGGYWLADVAGGAWQIGLGHRRLSIIDLSETGAQPMHGEGGQVLIFNGEIYNYIELRRELEAEGVAFNGPSDTEVLLRLLIRRGAACLAKLRGMFAFAYWDARSSELILARDHFGKKPLYLASLPGQGFAFGSELEPLLAMPGFDRSFDWDSLPEYLEYRYVPGPNTFFKNVSKLQPGHFAVWSDGVLRTERYYTPPYADAVDHEIDDGQAEQAFMRTLREAVSIRLRSDAPFGAFLSGGIDSATIVGLMAQELGSPVKTFSAGFDEAAYSELENARGIAAHFGTEHTEVVVRSASIIDHLPKAILHRGAPVSEPSDIPILLLSKAASGTVRMVLTGEGSDELLAGYPKHRVDGLLTTYQRLVPDALHRLLMKPLMKAVPYSSRRLAIALRAAGERDPEARMRVWFGATTEADRKALLVKPHASRPLDPFPFSSRASALKRTLFFDQTSWLPDNLLERGDRMMMAGSIEGRMPFMDTELARLVSTFPSRLLTGHAGGKAILRRATAGLLPTGIANRKKVGFRVPVGVWFQSSLKDYLMDHLSGPSAVTTAFYRRAALDRIVGEHVSGVRNHEKLLWALLNLEMFARLFKPSLARS